MTNDFYREMQAVASDVLREFDQTGPGDPDPASNGIYYIKVTPGNGRPDDPGQPGEVPYKLDAAARGAKFKYVDHTNILASDMQLIMAVRDDVTPAPNGFVSLDGTRYKIVRIDTIPPTGTPVAHRLFFRK